MQHFRGNLAGIVLDTEGTLGETRTGRSGCPGHSIDSLGGTVRVTLGRPRETVIAAQAGRVFGREITTGGRVSLSVAVETSQSSAAPSRPTTSVTGEELL